MTKKQSILYSILLIGAFGMMLLVVQFLTGAFSIENKKADNVAEYTANSYPNSYLVETPKPTVITEKLATYEVKQVNDFYKNYTFLAPLEYKVTFKIHTDSHWTTITSPSGAELVIIAPSAAGGELCPLIPLSYAFGSVRLYETGYTKIETNWGNLYRYKSINPVSPNNYGYCGPFAKEGNLSIPVDLTLIGFIDITSSKPIPDDELIAFDNILKSVEHASPFKYDTRKAEIEGIGGYPGVSFTLPAGWTYDREESYPELTLLIKKEAKLIQIRMIQGDGEACIFDGNVKEYGFEMDLRDKKPVKISSKLGDFYRYYDKTLDGWAYWDFCGPSCNNKTGCRLTDIGLINYQVIKGTTDKELAEMDAIISSIKIIH